MATHCWWPYTNRELTVKTTECKSCTTIGKNLKLVIPAKQIDIIYHVLNRIKKLQLILVVLFLTKNVMKSTIDRFAKYPTAFIYKKAYGSNVFKILDVYIETHGNPRSMRLDQVKCLVGSQVKTVCTRKNIQIIQAPVSDLRANGFSRKINSNDQE